MRHQSPLRRAFLFYKESRIDNMEHISSITIYNNEGFHFDTGHRYLITLKPHAAVIEYQDLNYTKAPAASPFCRDFDDIVSFLLNQLENNLGAHATHQMVFATPAEYKDWRHSLDFTDNDVSWYVNIEYGDGRYASYVSTEGCAIPAELDELELLVKEALDII